MTQQLLKEVGTDSKRGKVRVLRTVHRSDGSFEQHFWEAPNDVQPDDRVDGQTPTREHPWAGSHRVNFSTARWNDDTADFDQETLSVPADQAIHQKPEEDAFGGEMPFPSHQIGVVGHGPDGSIAGFDAPRSVQHLQSVSHVEGDFTPAGTVPGNDQHRQMHFDHVFSSTAKLLPASHVGFLGGLHFQNRIFDPDGGRRPAIYRQDTDKHIVLDRTAGADQLVHEIGHVVWEKLPEATRRSVESHYQDLHSGADGAGFLNEYSAGNVHEFFAEAYRFFYTQPGDLHQRNPALLNLLGHIHQEFQ